LKILILSDIHGNFYALDSVLKQVFHDMLICCGDLVVDFPFPEQCVSMLRDVNSHICIGNNDAWVAKNQMPSHHLKGLHHRYGAALDRSVELTRRLMSDESRTYLLKLPREDRFSIDGISFYMNHTGPDLPITRYLHSNTRLSELAGIYRNIRADIMITGHTHVPYVKKVGSGVLINPGSVGEPRDGDPRASFATFDTDTGQVELARLAYDREETKNRLEKLNFPRFSLHCLKHGRLPEDPDDDGS
jgi:putative phosphoesterase